MRSVGMTTYRFTDQELSAGDFQVISRDEVLLAGHVYVRGSVLAKLTGGANKGKLVMATSNAPANGSDAIYAVLQGDGIDATDGDTAVRVPITGEFAKDQLVFADGGYTADTADAYLRSVHSDLFFVDVLGVPSVE